MNVSRSVRVLLGALLVASVSLSFAGVNPASAQASITLSQKEAVANQHIGVKGSGFHPGASAVVFSNINTTRGKQRIQTATTVAGNGTLQATLPLPSDILPGTYTITATDTQGSSASSNLTVLRVVIMNAGAKPNSYPVHPGHTLILFGIGYQPGELVSTAASFPLYSGNTLVEHGSATADSKGHFGGVRVTVPRNAKQGTATVTSSGTKSGKTGKANLNVVYHPAISATARVRPGGTLHVTGYGFAAGAQVRLAAQVNLGNGSSDIVYHNVTANGNGQINGGVNLPNSTRPGTYGVTATDTLTGAHAGTRFTVALAATISVAPGTVSPGGRVTVTGHGFRGNADVRVSTSVALFGGGRRALAVTAHTNGNGDFSVALSIPRHAAAGKITVTAQGPTSHTAAQVTIRAVAASVSINPVSVAPGNTVTITGVHFPAGDHVSLSLPIKLRNGQTQNLTGTAVANGNGQFAVRLTIPGNTTGGAYTLRAVSQSTGRAPTARITVAALRPSIVVVPATAAPGTAVQVNGFGFAPGARMTLTINGQKVSTTTANGAGQFTVHFNAPNLATGTYTITATSSFGRTATIPLAINRTVSTHFYFASQYTGKGYSEYLAFLNPTQIRASVTIQYDLKGGATKSKTISVPAHSRITEDVNADLGYHVSAGSVISADVPIVAERVMYHNADGGVVPGARAPSTIWYFANGNTGKGYREYIAMENPNHAPVQVAIHILPTHHRAFTVRKTIPPTARMTLKVNKYVKKDAEGVILTSSGPIVANRSIFIKHGTTTKIGVNAPQRTWYFAAGPRNGKAHNWIGAINTTNHWAYITLHTYAPNGLALGTHTGRIKPFGRAGYLINRLAHRADAAVVFQSSVPTVVEQTTYMGKFHNQSTDTFGVPTPFKTWTFSAANTTSGQRDDLDLFNPSLSPIPIVVQFMTGGGHIVTRTYVVGPLAHQYVDVTSVMPNQQMGIVASSSVPFVAMNRYTFNNGTGAATDPGVQS